MAEAESNLSLHMVGPPAIFPPPFLSLLKTVFYREDGTQERHQNRKRGDTILQMNIITYFRYGRYSKGQ